MPMSHQSLAIVSKEEVELFLGLFQHLDGDIYSLLRDAKIPNDILTNRQHYQYLPETTIKNVLDLMGRSSSKEEFALYIWNFCKQVYVPRFVAQLSQESSLKSALEQFCEQIKLQSSDANMYVTQSGGKWWFVREKQHNDSVWAHFSELFAVVFMNELLLKLTQGQWAPTEVGIQGDDIESFQCLPQMGPAQLFSERPVTAFCIPETMMLSPIVLARQAQARPKAEDDAKGNSAFPNTFVPSFCLAIKPYLSMGKLPISLASDILNIHVRTIQRRLDKEGVTYKKLIEDIVLEQTLELLKYSDLSITSIGSKMGYSDSSHFTRAFKRQMNMTPRQYRKSYC